MGKLNMSDLIALAGMKFPEVEKSFYSDIREYIRKLESEVQDARDLGDRAAEDIAEHRIEKAKKYYQKIYNRRMEALFTNAIKKLTSKKSNVTLAKFTPEEVKMFREIMDIVEFNRESLLSGEKDIFDDGAHILEKTDDAEEERTEEVEEQIAEEPEEKREENSQISEEAPAESVEKTDEETKFNPKKKMDLITIRMVDDSENFMALDGKHTYSLKKGDIVNIERTLGELLIKMKKAEVVEPRW